MDRNNINTSEALEAYFTREVASCTPYGNGHINDTFLVQTEQERYILQRINTYVFPRPVELMENILAVTEHIRNKSAELGGDVRRSTLVVLPTLAGENYFCDSNNGYWRLYEFTERTVTCEKVENVEQFYRCGAAFGNFQQLLADFPANTLHLPIPNLHNTPWRYENLMRSAEQDVMGRASGVKDLLAFVKEREVFCHILEKASLPLRVTHNDTKLNNILFDESDLSPVCVIDLDTVMPGYAVTDFGDSIRSGANTASENDSDPANVRLDIDLFAAYTKGFIEGCNGSLTEKELSLLAESARLITLECGMRFLTDYLDGDVYFKIHYPCQNLDRARIQFALVKDMESKLPQMREIVRSLSK